MARILSSGYGQHIRSVLMVLVEAVQTCKN